MKSSYRIASIIALSLLVIGGAVAQVTFTKADLEAGFVNATRTEYGHQYMFGAFPSIDLGNASGASQTFDFTSAPAGDLWHDTLAASYLPAAGLPGYSEFPGATLGLMEEFSPDTNALITFVNFFALENDGFYALGTYARQYFPPFLDTTGVSKYVPRRLLFPLPMTYGTSRVSTDTVTDAGSGEYEVTTRSITCNGFGSITFPPTAALPLSKTALSEQGLRIVTDDQINVFDGGGNFLMHARNKELMFVGVNATVFTLSVEDSNYTSGSAAVMDRSLSIKTGTTGVQPLPSAVPEHFALSQNYPNPFNPSTKITFAVPAEGFVALTVYDVLGREVAALVRQEMSAGSYTVDFDAANLAGGLYLARLTSGSFAATMKMNLVK